MASLVLSTVQATDQGKGHMFIYLIWILVDQNYSATYLNSGINVPCSRYKVLQTKLAEFTHFTLLGKLKNKFSTFCF